MSLNQQLRARGVSLAPPRLFALMALVALAVFVTGCASTSSSGDSSGSMARSAPAAPAPGDVPPADDMTATEAAIAAMNEAPRPDAAAQTAQLLRPDAPMSYTVKRGDTLWDISAVFLKDPWFWPEIWQINPQVENPHLIYPGDVLSLAVGADGSARVFISQYSGARLQPRLRSESLDGPVDTLPFSAIAAFLSKPSVLTKEQALRAPHILAFRDHHMVGGAGHEIYVKNLNAPLNQRFSVMHVGDEIRDPESNDVVGFQAAYVATAVVNAPGKVSKALLTEGAREALQGDRLISQEGDVPLTFSPHAPHTDVDGQIIGIADDATQIGQYQVVILNRGERHGLAPGAVLAIDQRGATVQDLHSQRPWRKDPWGEFVQLPYERAGTLIVFKVFPRISYGLVIGARGPMQVADRVYNPTASSGRNGPSGTAFTPASFTQPAVEGQSGGGTVVFFREKKFAGAAVRFKVRENDVELCKLGSGTYCVVNLPAGAHEFMVRSEAKDTMRMEVEPGETYYVQGSVSMGFLVGHPNLAPSNRAIFEGMRGELADNTGKDVGGTD
jgi:hypothetical protein